VPVDQLGHGRPAQGGELEPARVRGTDQVAQHGAQRVPGAHGLPVGQHEQQRQRADAAGQEPHEVQGRLVAPVQVLDHQGARPGLQRVQHGGEDLVLDAGLAEHGRHLWPELAGDVAERAERARCAQRVAHAPQHRHRRLSDELAEKDGLADPGLPGEQHDRAPARSRAAGTVAEDREGMVALEQAHAPSLENQRSRRTDRSRESGSVPDTEPRRGWQGGHRPDPGST
jgi:hypothetical protein